MPRSPDTGRPPSLQRARRASRSSSTESTGMRARSPKALADIGRARGSGPACRLPVSTTRARSGLNIAGLGRASSRRRVRALACPAARFEAVTLRLGILHALREIGVARLERCARDRALRRQIDDELSAGARRNSHSRHLGDGIARCGRASDRAAREPAGPAGAQAAVRLAGPRPEADPNGGRPARSGTRSPGVYYLQRFRRRRAATAASAISACSSRRGASSPPWRGTPPAGSRT